MANDIRSTMTRTFSIHINHCCQLKRIIHIRVLLYEYGDIIINLLAHSERMMMNDYAYLSLLLLFM